MTLEEKKEDMLEFLTHYFNRYTTGYIVDGEKISRMALYFEHENGNSTGKIIDVFVRKNCVFETHEDTAPYSKKTCNSCNKELPYFNKDLSYTDGDLIYCPYCGERLGEKK